MMRAILILLLFVPSLGAAEPVAQPESHERFTITYTYEAGTSQPGETPPRRPAQAEYILAGDISRATIEMNDGSRKVIFLAGGKAFVSYPDRGNEIYVESIQKDSGEELLFRESYPGCAWIRAAHFKNEREIDGVLYDVFSKAASAPRAPVAGEIMADSQQQHSGAQEALVEKSSRRPFRVRQGGVSMEYQFQAPPREPIQIPARFLEAMRKNL